MGEKKEKKEKKEKTVEGEIKKEKKEKKEKKVEMTEEEAKAAKKAEKKAKKAAEAAAGGGSPAPAQTEEEVKSAKKAAKKAAKRAAEGGGEEEPPKKKKKAVEEEAAPAEEEVTMKVHKPAAAAAPAEAEAEQTRVYVANLPFSVDDDSIKATFASCGAITKVEWMTHSDTGRFKGSGFLTFESGAAAAAATGLNGQDNGGRPMKVEVSLARAKPAWDTGAPEDQGEPSASLYLGNLAWSIDEKAVRALFEGCGEISQVKWHEKEGQFTGKAFVDFDSIESATAGAKKHGADLCGRPVRINFSKPRANAWAAKDGAAGGGRVERPYKPAGPKPDGCVELFCGNLPWSIDDDKMTAFFKDCGTVTATRWLNDKVSGEFKGVGWVTFETTEMVDKAVAMGGENLEGRPIRIDYAGQKKEKPAWGGAAW